MGEDELGDALKFVAACEQGGNMTAEDARSSIGDRSWPDWCSWSLGPARLGPDPRSAPPPPRGGMAPPDESSARKPGRKAVNNSTGSGRIRVEFFSAAISVRV